MQATKDMPRCVIIGRPNVGKSTLFNRLIRKKKALVHNIAGVTRDRHEHFGSWDHGKYFVEFCFIDTGGMGGEHFHQEIDDQVAVALKEADLVLWVFDGQSGLTPMDKDLFLKMK